MDMSHHKDNSLPTTVTGNAWSGVEYFCTTREGGQSQGNYATMNLGLHTQDNAADIQDNRRRLRQLLPSTPLWLRQVHGIAVADGDKISAEETPQADAAVTTQRNKVLAILTADCLPVVITDQDSLVLGVAHAGWRGLCHGVLEATLQAMRERCPQAQEWRAWIGPAIGPQAFEVGEEVRQAFLEQDPAAKTHFIPALQEGKWMADLPALAEMRLRGQGVKDVTLSGLCSYRQPEQFFSYRRQAESGRMATCAWLKPKT